MRSQPVAALKLAHRPVSPSADDGGTFVCTHAARAESHHSTQLWLFRKPPPLVAPSPPRQHSETFALSAASPRKSVPSKTEFQHGVPAWRAGTPTARSEYVTNVAHAEHEP